MPILFFDPRSPIVDVSFKPILKNLTSKILFLACFSKNFHKKKEKNFFFDASDFF